MAWLIEAGCAASILSSPPICTAGLHLLVPAGYQSDAYRAAMAWALYGAAMFVAHSKQFPVLCQPPFTARMEISATKRYRALMDPVIQ